MFPVGFKDVEDYPESEIPVDWRHYWIFMRARGSNDPEEESEEHYLLTEEEKLIQRRIVSSKPIQSYYSLTEKGKQIAQSFVYIHQIIEKIK